MSNLAAGPRPKEAATDRVAAPTFSVRDVGWRYAPVAVIAVVIALWLVGYGLVPHVVASPQDAASALASGWQQGWVQEGLRSTFGAAATAFVLCSAAGLGIGFALGLSGFWGDVFEPLLLWLFSIPKLIFYPIIMLLFGIGIQSTIAFGTISGVLPVSIIVFSAVRSVPRMHLKVASIYGLNRRQIFTEIIVPVVLPSIVTALRYGFSLSFIGVILAEMFAARQGFGQVLMGAMFIDDKARVFGIATVLVIAGFAVNFLFLSWQRRVESSFGTSERGGDKVWPVAG